MTDTLLTGIIALVAILLFISGCFMLWRGMATIPSKPVILSENFDQLKSDYDQMKEREQALTSQLDAITLELRQTKELLQKAQESMKRQDAGLRAKIQHLEKDLMFLTQKADVLAKDAIAVIQWLQDKNAELNRENMASRQAAEAQQQSTAAEETLRQELTRQAQRMEVLESELQLAQQRYEEHIERLTDENSRMYAERAQLQKALAELTTRLREATREYDVVQSGFQKSLASAQQLCASLQAEQSQREQDVRQQLAEEFQRDLSGIRAEEQARANAAAEMAASLEQRIAEMAEQLELKERSFVTIRDELEKSQEDALKASMEVKALLTENRLLQEKLGQAGSKVTASPAAVEPPPELAVTAASQRIDQQIQDLQNTNRWLREREQYLQTELVKNRVQILGLQEMCDIYQKESMTPAA